MLSQAPEDLAEDVEMGANRADEGDEVTKLVLTNFEILKSSSQTLPDQLSKLINGVRVQNDQQVTFEQIFSCLNHPRDSNNPELTQEDLLTESGSKRKA